MRALTLLLATAACGRFEFAHLPDASTGDGDRVDGPRIDAPACGALLCLDPTLDGDGVRILDVGNLDNASFGSRGVAIQPDGKLVVVGTLGSGPGNSMLVARLLDDGTLDPGFATGGTATFSLGPGGQELNAVVSGPGGTIIVAGEVSGAAVVIARLTANGVLDPSFAGGFGTAAFTIAASGSLALNGLDIDANGRIVAGGQAELAGSGGFNVLLVRLVENGALDPTFDGDGKLVRDLNGGDEFGTFATIGPNGTLYWVGQTLSGTFDGATLRLLDDGSPDPTFGTGGIVQQNIAGADRFNALVIDNMQRLVFGGTTNDADFVIGRYLSNGMLDTSFGAGGLRTADRGVLDRVHTVALLPDGRILAGGEAKIGGIARGVLILMTATGVIETMFDIPAGGSASTVNYITIDRMGRIVVFGSVTNANTDLYVARYAIP